MALKSFSLRNLGHIFAKLQSYHKLINSTNVGTNYTQSVVMRLVFS